MVKKLASNNITTNYNTSEPANVVYDCKKQLKFILSRHKKECKRHWTEKQWEKIRDWIEPEAVSVMIS